MATEVRQSACGSVSDTCMSSFTDCMLVVCEFASRTIFTNSMVDLSSSAVVSAGAAAAIDKRKKLMSYLSAALLALVPWMQVGDSSDTTVAARGLRHCLAGL